MKFLIPLLALAASSLAQEIESVPAEQTQKIARLLTTTLGTPADAPFTVDTDTDKASALKGGDGGALVIPDKKLTQEALAAAGEKPVVIGQLWMRNVVPAVGGSAPAAEKLRTLTVRNNDNEQQAQVYFLAATKGAHGLELSLFAKDKEPLVKVPLTKTDAEISATALSMNAHKNNDQTGTLVLSVFGSYKADITATKPRQ